MTDHTEQTSPTRQFAPLAIILGIPLLFAAVFFFTSPIVLETGGEQGIFKCGSPSSPNSDAANVCDRSEKIERNKAIYSGLSGVALLGLGAVWMLRGRQHDDEWDEDSPRRRRDDDIDLSDEDRGRGRDESLRSGAHSRRSRREDDDTLRGVGRDRGRGRAAADDLDAEPEPEAEETRAGRRGGRRPVRDDDFADPAPRRRTDDDWSSDGWR